MIAIVIAIIFLSMGGLKMGSVVIKAEKLNLPGHMADKLKGKKIELIETNDGILIRPFKGDPIKDLKGFLKGSKFTTAIYLQQKNKDKVLE
jgi:hypothetical protein